MALPPTPPEPPPRAAGDARVEVGGGMVGGRAEAARLARKKGRGRSNWGFTRTDERRGRQKCWENKGAAESARSVQLINESTSQRGNLRSYAFWRSRNEETYQHPWQWRAGIESSAGPQRDGEGSVPAPLHRGGLRPTAFPTARSLLPTLSSSGFLMPTALDARIIAGD